MLTLTQDVVTEGLGLCRVHVAGVVGEAGTVVPGAAETAVLAAGPGSCTGDSVV